MQNNIQNDIQYDDEIDLRELFGVLWAGSRQILAITVVFAFVSVIYSLSLPNHLCLLRHNLIALTSQEPWVSWVVLHL